MDKPPERNGNGSWRKMAVIAAGIGVLLSIASYIFGAGKADAAFDQRMTRTELDVQTIRTDYARKDVFEQRLSAIERAQEKIEKNEEEQARMLNEILMETRKHR